MFVSDAAGVSLTVLGYSNGITLCPQGSLLFGIWIENIFCIQCIAVDSLESYNLAEVRLQSQF